MRGNLGCLVLAIALGCAGTAAQQKHPPPAIPQASSRYGIAPAPTALSISHGGVINGYVFWPTNAAQYNHAAPCQGLWVRVVPRGSGTLNVTDNNLTSLGTVGGYTVCTYSVQGLPEGVDLHVLFLPSPPGFTPSLTFNVAPVDRQYPHFYVNIPGGACNTPASANPSVSELTTSGWRPCGDYAYDVNFGVYPSNVQTARVAGPVRVALGTAVESGASKGMLLAPGAQTTMLMQTPPKMTPVTPQSSTQSRYGSAPNPVTALKAGGTAAGYIFWDSRRVAYSPSTPCQGLQVELTAITATGIQPLGNTSQFTLQQPTQPGSSLRMCSYSFNHVPEGVALQVQVHVAQLFASQVVAKGPFPLGPTGTLVKVPGGKCNNSSNGTAPSETYLESGWQGCGEQTNNVNFQLLPQ